MTTTTTYDETTMPISDGYDCFRSPEFRLFATRWLGFDPLSPEHKQRITGISININIGEVVNYSLHKHGVQRMGAPRDVTNMLNEHWKTMEPAPEAARDEAKAHKAHRVTKVAGPAEIDIEQFMKP